MFRPPLTLAVAALAAGLVFAPNGAAADCLADWGLAAQVVKRESLLTVEQISGAEAGAIPGQIVKTTLCKEQGGYVYRLVVRDANGQLRNVVVDAQNHGQGQAKAATKR